MRGPWLALVVLLLCQPSMNAGAHHMALRFNIEEMAAGAETVFYGACTDVKETYEELGGGKVPISTYTFTVYEVLRGKEVSALSIKALGHASPTPTKKPGEIYVGGKVWSKDSALHDMPNYAVGEEHVVFLSAPDKWGLQVPMGRSQGSFKVSAKAGGFKDVRNSMDNRSLFTTPYTGFALQKGVSVFPKDNGATVAAFASIPDIDTLLRRRGPIELETFLDIIRIVVSGL
jgi:hypothetical protein